MIRLCHAIERKGAPVLPVYVLRTVFESLAHQMENEMVLASSLQKVESKYLKSMQNILTFAEQNDLQALHHTLEEVIKAVPEILKTLAIKK